MIAKLHKSREGRTILAVCDSDIFGKKFEENDLQLDLCSGFYKGEKMDEKRITELFKVVSIVNLVGEKSVSLGIKSGVIEKENVKKISGIPYAQAIVQMD